MNCKFTSTVRTQTLKTVAIAFKLSVLKKIRMWMPFNVVIHLNDVYLFRNKKINTFCPPLPKKRRRDTNDREHGYTHMCLFIPGFLLGRY